MMHRRSFFRRSLAAIATILGVQQRATPSSAQSTGAQGSSKAGERLAPLFLSEADARAVIAAYCTRDAKPPLITLPIDLILSRLRPQLWIARAEGEGAIGTTRMGGAPDLPKGAAWPMRPALPDRARAQTESTTPSPWLVRQLGETVPFEFVAQIDLAEAAAFPAHADGLPPIGRLLFFLDMGVLMDTPSGSVAACHVLFDETPRDGLARSAIPAQFDAMEAWWRTPDPRQADHLEQVAKMLEAQGMQDAADATRQAAQETTTPDDTTKKPFVYPARTMKLVPLMVLPDPSTLELFADKDLRTLADGDETSGCYSLLVSNDSGPFTADPNGLRVTQDWLTREARRNRLLGPPVPEQDDPRYDAIPASEQAPMPWTGAVLDSMTAKAEEWQLLLQVAVADLAQQQTEGTLYFMVRRDALAKRDFSAAIVTYQQT